MYNHAPDGYDCLFCRVVRQMNDPAFSDAVWQTESATAFLGLRRWVNNPVDVLVIPNRHYENLFDLPAGVVPGIHQMTRAVALALKSVYHCDGISTRQHNEPAGDQDVWHYHVHVTPRFANDGFYRSGKIEFPEKERAKEASRLRKFIVENQEEIFRED